MPRVLVVDDTPSMLDLIKTHFEQAGAEVKPVDNAQEALSLAKASMDLGSAFDMIVIDIVMPEMNGYQLAKSLRESGYEGAIVAFTATASGTGRRDGKEAGITTYLSKDTLKPDLIEALLSQHCP